MRLSAYLSVFDDWDILATAVARIYDRVEEIVVVDGAYAWMAPVFAAAGRDPSISLPEMRATLAPFAPKLRFVTGLWRNEVAKRTAGFETCTNRHILRIDADEVLFFDDAEIERFLASGHGVAEMEMPVYLAPGLIRAHGGGRRIERQSVLFDRDRVSAAEHCAYLWLVLPAAERAMLPKHRPALVHQVPIAFNAHLTQWRTPTTALTRARFYLLNYARETRGLPFLPGLPPDGDDLGFTKRLVQAASPEALTDILLGQSVALGLTALDGFGVHPTPLDGEQEARFAGHFAEQLDALAVLNSALTQDTRTLLAGEDCLFDLSTAAARAALGDGGEIAFAFSTSITRADATLQWQSATSPFDHVQRLEARVQRNRVWVAVAHAPPDGAFRCVLRLRVTPASEQVTLRMMAHV